MGNTLFAIGEALIDFIPAQTGCAFEEERLSALKAAERLQTSAERSLSLVEARNLSLSLVMTHSEER